MEASEGRGDLFRLTDPRQVRIYNRLLLVGPGPAAFYKDACRLVSEFPLLESTTHLVAHLLREIESALRDVLESMVKVADGSQVKGDLGQATHKAEIQSILKCLEIPMDDPVAEAWFSLADRESNYALHALAHRRQLIQPRPVDNEFRDFWNKAQTVLDAVLDRFEAHYISIFDAIDKVISKSPPSTKDLQDLQRKVPSNLVTRNYLFSRLSDCWLLPLKDTGFFKHPPGPVVDEQKQIVSFPTWPESQYLARMASKSPELVLEIVRDIPDTDNVRIHESLVDACLALPAEMAAECADKEAKWVATQEDLGHLLPRKLGALIAYLARGQQVGKALVLARSLLDTLPVTEKGRDPYAPYVPREARIRMDVWNYEQILKESIPDLVTTAQEHALALLCDLLDSALRTYVRRMDRDDPKDYSYMWRPALEEREENYDDVKDLLVSAVCDAAIQIGKADPTRIQSIVRQLEQRQWPVFQRIALFLLRALPEGMIPIIAQRLTDRAIFDKPDLWHEYALLAKEHFGRISEHDQQVILGWINAGPQVIDIDHKKDVEQDTDRWRLRCLAPIRDSLPMEWKLRYEEMVREFGEPEHPEFVFHIAGGVGPTSPKNADELRAMSVSEIVAFLRRWHPPGGIMTPSPEGLGRQLSGVVSSDPERFASHANEFRVLDPTYVRAVLSGLEEAAKQGRQFSWVQVLELCRWAIEQPHEIAERTAQFGESDPDWTWTHKTIARLISVGLKSEIGAAEIPYSLRNTVWEILKPLTDDPDPTPEYEKDHYGPANMDPATLSINTTRGEAMHGVMSYALWVRRNAEKKSDGKSVSHGFHEMPEVREVLDAHLDVQREATLAIRAVYGQHYPWLLLLDRAWAIERRLIIFPKDESLRDFYDVAWETYLVFCHPYDEVFDALREEYEIAVESIGEDKTKWRHMADPKQRLVEHLMAMYWRGKLQLTDNILKRFYEKAPDMLLGHAIAFMGRSLLNTHDEIPGPILDRLKKLWECRLEAARSSGSISHRAIELTAFGWWFASAKFEDAWALAQLSEVLSISKSIEAEHQVLKRLSILAPQFPEQTIDCLSLMTVNERASWTILPWREEIRAIMASTIKSTSKSAAKKTAILINRLSATGHLQFRDLLNASD